MANGPWGSSGDGNNGERGPDIDNIVRDAQERFRQFGGNGGGRRPPRGATPLPDNRSILLGALAVLAALWLGSGFYRVQPEENAVIMTFGEWTGTRGEPGLGYHLPWPVQDVIKLNVAFDRRIEIGFRDNAGDKNAAVSAESMMLTGDENIIDINFVVLWRISDAGKYLFKIRSAEDTVKKVAESAMREVIGQTEIQKAMTGARSDIEAATKALMQKILDEYESGVVINSVQLLRVDPPAPVVDAFDDVQRARTDLERLKNEAETYRNDIVPRARGEAQKLQQDAEAYRQAVTSKAGGEAARFLSVYNAYQSARDVTQQRLYLETLEGILKNSKKIIVGGDGKNTPLLPYMLDAQNKTGDKQ